MATDLDLLTNSKLTGNESPEYFEHIREKLMALPLGRASYWHKGKWVKEEGDWNYRIEQEDKNVGDEFRVLFDGPYSYFLKLYKNVGIISTINRYSHLYMLYENGWHESFRKDIYGIIKAIGATEIICVADNACDKLCYYLACAWENMPYEEIKTQMINEMGPPVTDYSKLDPKKLDYRNINEFLLDDFKDFGLQEKPENDTDAIL